MILLALFSISFLYRILNLPKSVGLKIYLSFFQPINDLYHFLFYLRIRQSAYTCILLITRYIVQVVQVAEYTIGSPVSATQIPVRLSAVSLVLPYSTNFATQNYKKFPTYTNICRKFFILFLFYKEIATFLLFFGIFLKLFWLPEITVFDVFVPVFIVFVFLQPTPTYTD